MAKEEEIIVEDLSGGLRLVYMHRRDARAGILAVSYTHLTLPTIA